MRQPTRDSLFGGAGFERSPHWRIDLAIEFSSPYVLDSAAQSYRIFTAMSRVLVDCGADSRRAGDVELRVDRNSHKLFFFNHLRSVLSGRFESAGAWEDWAGKVR